MPSGANVMGMDYVFCCSSECGALALDVHDGTNISHDILGILCHAIQCIAVSHDDGTCRSS